MPISHRHRCIFVHIPKTAGTSIEHVLGMRGPWFREDRRGMFGLIRSRGLKNHKFLSLCLQHLTIQDLRFVLPAKIYAAYFKFSFVRNPWDKVVSSYFDKTNSLEIDTDGLPFEEFIHRIKNMSHIHLLQQHKFILNEEGEVAVDFLGRYENLNRDFRKVCKRIGLRYRRLPIFFFSKHKHYSSYYTKETREIVARLFKKDIEIFGYDF